VKAAIAIAAGKAAAGGLVSAKVAAMTKGAMKMLFWMKVKTAAAVVAAIMVGVGVPVGIGAVKAQETPTPGPTTAQAGDQGKPTIREEGPMKMLIEQGDDLRNESFGARRIVRRGEISYVGYSRLLQGKWLVSMRAFDHRKKAFGPAVDIAPGTDDHSVMGLVCDSQGRLHCVSGGHGALVYTRTVRPDDISQWTSPQQIGSGTYPMLMIDRQDRMYVFYRSGPQETELAMQTCLPGGQWTAPEIIGRTTGPVFYIMGVAMGNEGASQSLHVVGHFYGKAAQFGKPWPDEVYDYRVQPWYIRSLDGGKTWQKADGRTLRLPVDEKNIDILFDFAQPYDIPWSVDVCVDAKNIPHVFCAWSYREPSSSTDRCGNKNCGKWNCQGFRTAIRGLQTAIGKMPSRLWHLTWENSRWTQMPIDTPAVAGAYIDHPAVVSANDALHVAVSVTTLQTARPRGEDPTGKLLHLWSPAQGKWNEELIDTHCAYANWKLPDTGGALELMWRGAAQDGKVALYYSCNLSGSLNTPAR
jgi:hypothetical protein